MTANNQKFLVLAPEAAVKSAPTTRYTSIASSSVTSPLNETKVDPILLPTEAPVTKQRRSSSISSTSSATKRFLKLSPIQYSTDAAESEFVEVEEQKE